MSREYGGPDGKQQELSELLCWKYWRNEILSASLKCVISLAPVQKCSKVFFKDETVVVEELTHDSFEDVDLVLASAGGSISKEFLPTAVKNNCISIDNTSAFRMDPDTPLVIPEVNMHAAHDHQGIIANPNCSTIQMLVALKPIYDAAA